MVAYFRSVLDFPVEREGSMKKPMNRFAVAMWVAAAVVAVLNAFQFQELQTITQRSAGIVGFSHLPMEFILRSISGVIMPTVMLAGLGGLIEIVDQVRWNTRPKQ
jgi:hypothetical protein